MHRLARFNCETISYSSLEFVWTEAFPCFWHSNLDKKHITEAGIDLFSNNICPGFSQGQKKAFLSVHLFQNCRVESTIISTRITYTHIMTMINVRSPGRPSLPTSSSEAGLTQRDYLAIGLCAGSHHHHHHHHHHDSQSTRSPPGFLVLLYMFAMVVLVVMKRKQKRDRLLREQFLNMPLPTVRRDDDHRGDQDNNDHPLLKDDFFRCKVQNFKRICTNAM